jgi:hypothetical protein
LKADAAASSDFSRNRQPLHRFMDFVLNPSTQALAFRGTPMAVVGRAFDAKTPSGLLNRNTALPIQPDRL